MKAISEVAKDALELPLDQRSLLRAGEKVSGGRMRCHAEGQGEVSQSVLPPADDEIFRRRMAEVKAGRARSAGFDEVFDRLDRVFPTGQFI